MQLARYDTVLVRVSSEENKSRRSWIVRRLSSQAAEKKKAFSFVIRAAYSHWRTHKSSIAPLKAANARPPPAIALTPLFRARIRLLSADCTCRSWLDTASAQGLAGYASQ